MTKKRICFVCEYMLCGGVEKSLLSLLQALPPARFDITVLLLQKKGELLDQIPDWVHVKEMELPSSVADDLLIGKGNALKKAVRERHLLRAAKKAINGLLISVPKCSGEMKRVRYYDRISLVIPDYPESFDVVIDYMGYGLFNTFYAAKKMHAEKKLSWIHFDVELSMGDISAYTNYFSDFDRLVCVSQEIREKSERKLPQFKEKFRVFHNVIQTERIWQLANEGTGFTENDPTPRIVSVGRLDPQKGFDLALIAFNKLKKEGYLFHWYIIGEGHQREELEKLVREYQLTDDVTLMGRQLNPYPYIAQCDLYFQPSRHEAYGIAAAEARVLCRPVLCTDFSGAREQFRDGETARIVKCEVQELYTGLKEMLDHPELRDRFRNLLEEEKPTVEGIADEFDQLISD